jgi:hypothetical protein
MAAPRERWLLTLELPPGLPNAARFVARVLKHLLRTWGVRCTAAGESAELRRLQGIVAGLADRVAAQAEVLARRAERQKGQEAAPDAPARR